VRLCTAQCRQPLEEAKIVHRADHTKDSTQPLSNDGREAHLDPLADSHPNGKHSSAPLDVTAERQARRERALKAQQEQEAAKAAAEESESEYETVCSVQHLCCGVPREQNCKHVLIYLHMYRNRQFLLFFSTVPI
jgi:hypothetical protein